MSGNMSNLIDYKEIDRGYIAFERNPKGGKITRKGSGPDWLFDIDALTRTMNCKLIVAFTQSNGFVDPKSSHDDEFKPSCDDGKKVDEDLTGTNRINAVGENISSELPFDPDMTALEDISRFNITTPKFSSIVMSTFTHLIIVLFDSDVEDAFSSTHSPDYTSASPDYFLALPRNTSSSYENGLIPLAISSSHDDSYMHAIQAYDDNNNEPLILPQAFTVPPTVSPPSPVLSLS
uniref:Uncharacterized protein n=1 Tax=Tanacetum cinerariifolium TaxID=118510 RepID=A0A6L2N5A6_TANCI|nr:hypothetical protein [Tanacetum cinerariifolium]